VNSAQCSSVRAEGGQAWNSSSEQASSTGGPVDTLLSDWRDKEKDWGQLYLEYEPVTPPDRVASPECVLSINDGFAAGIC
jgi:hypothetical protein